MFQTSEIGLDSYLYIALIVWGYMDHYFNECAPFLFDV